MHSFFKRPNKEEEYVSWAQLSSLPWEIRVPTTHLTLQASPVSSWLPSFHFPRNVGSSPRLSCYICKLHLSWNPRTALAGTYVPIGPVRCVCAAGETSGCFAFLPGQVIHRDRNKSNNIQEGEDGVIFTLDSSPSAGC